MLNTNAGGIDPATRTFTQYAGGPGQGGNPGFPLGVLQGNMQAGLGGGRPGILPGAAAQQQQYRMPNQAGVQQYGQARAGLPHTMINGIAPNLNATALAARVQHPAGLVNPNLASSVRPGLDRTAAGNMGLQALGAGGVGNTAQSLAGLSWANNPPTSLNMLAGNRALGNAVALNQFGGGLSIQNAPTRLNPQGALGTHLLQPGLGNPTAGYNMNPSQDLFAIISKQAQANAASARSMAPNAAANAFSQQQLNLQVSRGPQVSAASSFQAAASAIQQQAAAAAAAAAAAQNQQEQQEQPAFDPSDFPSLAGATGRPGQGQLQGNDGLAGVGSDPYPGLRKLGQHSDFSIQNPEDFPALPGAAAGGQRHEPGTAGGAGQVGRMPHMAGMPGEQMGGGGDPGRGGAQGGFPEGLNAQTYPELLRLQQQRQLQQTLNLKAAGAAAALQAATQQQAAQQAQQAEMRFGLLGLLSVIRMTDPDLTMLALGVDLTSLGLNLNSSDNLYKAFVSPLADTPIVTEPEFEVPQCYKHRPPQLQAGFLSKFKEETLFYVFHSMPQDEAQLIAADELSVRGWWFHKALKCWLSRVPNTPVQKTPRGERGSWHLFDTQIWDLVRKDDVEIAFEDLETPPRLKRLPAARH